MTTLYNCKTDGDNWRITKFDTDLNPISSYLCTERECECPAGHRPTCRHRTMLPRFLAKSATRGNWFHNFEQNEWVRASSEDEDAAEECEVEQSQAIDANEVPAHPFTMLDLAKTLPEILFNTIADAVGESTSPNSDFATAMREQPKPLRRL